MNLKSLEHVLEGVGKLRAASVVAAVASYAAMLGLQLSPGVQKAGLLGATVLIAVVNIVDGYIRGQHVSALPALIEQGAESVAKVQDPRVDAVAGTVETLAARVAAVEGGPKPPTVQEVISALVGQGSAPVAAAGVSVPSEPVPAADVPVAPVTPPPAV